MSRHSYVQPPESGPHQQQDAAIQQPIEEFLQDETTPGDRNRPAKVRQRRRRTVVMVAAIALFAAVVLGLSLMLRDMLGMNEVTDYAGPGSGSVTFTVPEGAGAIMVGNGLEEQDIVAQSETFLSTLQEEADGRVIQPGDYPMKHQMSSRAAVEVLLTAEAGVHYAAIASGLRLDDVLDTLAEGTGIPRAEFAGLAENPQAFGLPAKAPSLEGYLAPGEYRFEIGTTAEQMLQQMVDKTFMELENAGVGDPAEQYRILTIASIVQDEAGKADYATVAGAIENRLTPGNKETNGFIQSDATVSYGLDRRSYQLTDEEKQDTSNPYNTYANKGLPIGPIGAPSQQAIEAAVNPADVPYYFWVTVNLDTSETKFSETYAEHLRYVEEYNQWCSEHPGRCD